jgi:hypothetical protein
MAAAAAALLSALAGDRGAGNPANCDGVLRGILYKASAKSAALFKIISYFQNYIIILLIFFLIPT